MVKRRLPAFFLALIAAVFSSCSAAPASDIAQMTGGGYREEQAADFPAFENLLALDQAEDGTYYAIGTMSDQFELGGDGTGVYFSGPYEVWCSEDGGLTWNRREYPGLSALAYLTSAAFAPDGSVTVCHTGEPGMESRKIALFDAEGMTKLPDIPYLNMTEKSLIWSSSDLLVRYANTYTQIGADGNQTHYYHGDVYSALGSAAVFGDTLAICNTDHISLYSLETGKETGKIKLPPSLQMEDGGEDVPVIAAQPDGAGLLYCNSTGVYRISMDGSLTERLIDSYQFMRDNPGAELQKVFAEPDGSLLLLLKRNRVYQLVRLTFDTLADRLPQQEVTVYSLIDVPYVRNTVRLYQKQHPEAAVTYRVGYTGKDDFSMEDALRSLSIELAAGRGADILILDGVPFMEYLNSDTLMDLSGLVEEAGSDALLENITGAYRSEQGLYAVPTRFSVPLIAGRGIEDVHEAEDLRVWLERNRDMYSGGYPAEIVKEWYYNARSWGWLNADGSRNNTAISDDLETLRAIEALLSIEADENEDWQNRTIAAKYVAGEVPLILATANNIMVSTYYISALSDTGGGSYQTMLTTEQSGIFVPQSILAVSAAGADKDGVADFARFLFSREAQAAEPRNGFPIREDAIRDIWASENAGATFATYDYAAEDERQYTITASWPSEAETAEFIEMLHTLGTPAANDALFRGAMLAEMAVSDESAGG